jgi:glycosyltransferase involved in cell wall biosynthesis
MQFRCGVEDYTNCLEEALGQAGVSVVRLGSTKWDLTSVRQLIRLARSLDCDLIHVQYPAIGFGATLAPHLMGFITRLPVLVTLHEFSLVHPLRKWSSGLFSLGAHRLIFTTAAESQAFTRAFPWYRSATKVIPVGSAIPFSDRDPTPDAVIVFFGHIKPNRNVEHVIAAADLAHRQGRQYRFRIIGSVPPRCTGYFEELQARAVSLPVQWLLNLGPHAVSAELRRATVAYLPYPEGASGRRGTLLAALGNGVPVVTTDGPLCPATLRPALRFAASPAAALEQIDNLVQDAPVATDLSQRGQEAVRDCSWPVIAAAHRELYWSYIRSETRRVSSVGTDT